MKGGKDEEKVMGPLFPRLHINDAEKGGPKAPPRNKMALYEQLSIPTQRFTSGSSSVLPLSHKSNGNSVPSTSSSHHKKSPYSLSGNAHASHLVERLHSHVSVGAILNMSSKNQAGQLKITSERDSGHLSIAAPCSNFQPHNFSNFKSTSTKRLREEDCRVPAFVQLENTLNSVDGPCEKDDFGTVTISRHLKSTSDLFSMPPMSTEGNIKIPPSCEGNAQKPSCEGNTQKPTSVTENKNELLEKRNCNADDSNRLHQKYQALQKIKSLEKGMGVDSENTLEKSNACTSEGGSSFKPSIRTDDQNHGNECEALQLVEAGKDAEITETCNLDYVSSVTISPDAVVEAIGQKQFWKARRAIVHQQKVFAVQVFELHRLIKVQRLFAENPDILMEDKFFLGKPSIKGSEKKLFLENAPEPLPITPLSKDDPQITKLIGDNNKGLNNLLSNYKPYSATDPIPSPWCFQQPPPGNQWLVPVMSPSEGLIYKPYTGPCPPTTGFPGPVHSGHMGLTTPIGEGYLRFSCPPPYCIPSLNPSISSSAVGPVGTSDKAWPKLNDQIPYPSSFSSYCMRNLIESKDSEMHGSTANSPDIKLPEIALPLFPTAPTVQALDEMEKTHTSMNCTHVIKVVPHNAGSASESAARIFQSIKEERRQPD